VARRRHGEEFIGGNMPRGNMLYLIVGALLVAVAVLGYALYDAKKEPKGVNINIGPKGLSIDQK
jgi:hypothetical protein